jgi:hypothetical protein
MGDLPVGLNPARRPGCGAKILRRAEHARKSDFLNRFNKSTRRANHPKVVKSPLKKYSAFQKWQINPIFFPILSH